MTGPNALSMQLIKPTGEQATVSSWYFILEGGNDTDESKFMSWHEIFWTTDKDMKVEMILTVE